MTGFEKVSDQHYRIFSKGQHIVVWEHHNGAIAKNHVIHHINGVKDDNWIENLVCLSRNDHNNHMKQPVEYNITCPHCFNSFNVIKKSHNTLIPTGSL